MLTWKLIACLTFLTVVSSRRKVDMTVIFGLIKHDFPQYYNASQAIIKKLLDSLSPTFNNNPSVPLVNDLTDDILNDVHDFIESVKLNPLPMIDIKSGFERTFLMITYKGHMSLTEGLLYDLDTIYRTGNLSVSITYPTITIRIPIGFKKLMFNYKYKAEFVGLGPSGNVEGVIIDTKCSVDIEVDLSKLKIKVKHFEMEHLGDITISFANSFLTDWISNIFVNVIVSFVKPIIKIIIDEYVHDGFEVLFAAIDRNVCEYLGLCNHD